MRAKGAVRPDQSTGHRQFELKFECNSEVCPSILNTVINYYCVVVSKR
jgi:hypothetical protein